MIKNKRKKKPPVLTPEQVAENARTFLAKAIDSGKFCVFIGYEENDQFHFGEYRTPMHVGNLYKMQDLMDRVIVKAALPVQRTSNGGKTGEIPQGTSKSRGNTKGKRP